jgi:potassium-transporting ATPase ATP-binding subunit
MSESSVPGGRVVIAPPPETRLPKVRTRRARSMFEAPIMRRAVRGAFVKLDPRHMVRNPVIFVVEIGSVITTVEFFVQPSLFVGLVTLFLWATVLLCQLR